MKHARSIFVLAVFATSLFGAATGKDPAAGSTPPNSHVSHYMNVLGTSLDLKIVAASTPAAEKAEAAVMNEIERQAKSLSAWDADSEFIRWSRTSGTPIHISQDFYNVLSLFDQWRTKTNGALDASAEIVIQAWKSAAAQHRAPTQQELDRAVAAVRQQHWSLNPSEQTATHLTDTPLVLSSFTKSYIMDRAVDAGFTAAPVSAIVINIGGDLVIRGAHVEKVEIADPRSDAENGPRLATLQLRDKAIATSGNYRRGVLIDGQHFSHIVDPRTGQPCEEVISSTVIATDPSTAGALATAFSVLSPAESKKLAASIGNVDYLILTKDGSRLESSGWQSLQVARAQTFAAKPEMELAPEPDDKSATWNTSMELAINLELAQIDAPRFRRPYVAVWIEDHDKFPLRTIALWSQKPRYNSDLKAWYADDQTRAAAEGSDLASSIASATRAAGKYTLKWDGKDNKGKLVKPGKYIVCIEAAREHGTYQIIRQEMDFTGNPKQIDLAGNTEISGASLDYRKATH